LGKFVKVIRVIVADDNVPFRSSLRMFIEGRYPARVIAEVGNGLEAVRATEQERPDLVILDISMPVMDGFLAAQNIRARYPDLPIIMISGNMDANSMREGLRCGAYSCVSKLKFVQELIPTIQTVLQGTPYTA